MRPTAQEKQAPKAVVIWKNPHPQGSAEAREFSRKAVAEATMELRNG